MLRVVIETPYKGKDETERADNVRFARACMLYGLREGVAPFASHLLYTQVLDDDDTAQRRTGLAACFALVRDFDASWLFEDRGLSYGMIEGGLDAVAAGRVRRHLLLETVAPDLWRRFLVGDTFLPQHSAL